MGVLEEAMSEGRVGFEGSEEFVVERADCSSTRCSSHDKSAPTLESPAKAMPPLRAFPTSKNQRIPNDTCAICLDSFTTTHEKRTALLPCNHIFGEACINTWLATLDIKKCPLCQRRVSAMSDPTTKIETPVLTHTKFLELSPTVKLLSPLPPSEPQGWIVLLGSENGGTADDLKRVLWQAADLGDDAFEKWKFEVMKCEPVASFLDNLYGHLRCTWSLYRAENAEGRPMIVACGPSPDGKRGALALDYLRGSGLVEEVTIGSEQSLVLKIQTMSLGELQIPPVSGLTFWQPFPSDTNGNVRGSG